MSSSPFSCAAMRFSKLSSENDNARFGQKCTLEVSVTSRNTEIGERVLQIAKMSQRGWCHLLWRVPVADVIRRNGKKNHRQKWSVDYYVAPIIWARKRKSSATRRKVIWAITSCLRRALTREKLRCRDATARENENSRDSSLIITEPP